MPGIQPCSQGEIRRRIARRISLRVDAHKDRFFSDMTLIPVGCSLSLRERDRVRKAKPMRGIWNRPHPLSGGKRIIGAFHGLIRRLCSLSEAGEEAMSRI